MITMLSRLLACIAVTVLLVLQGCTATRSDIDPDMLLAANRPAFSIAIQQPDIVVAVSPIRQTMQIGGSIPTVLGAGISAVQDGYYAKQVHAVLDGYDCNTVFEHELKARLQQHLGEDLISIMPLGTAAGYHTLREARNARIEGLRRREYDYVLDFDLSYGIYGPEGLLATRIAGEMIDISTGRVVWRNTLSKFSVELYADLRWRDPTERLTANYFSPRLTTADDAIDQWTVDGGTYLKESLEQSIRDTVAAVFTDMGLESSVRGHYVLGVHAVLNRNYDTAIAHFEEVLSADPDMVEATNGLALAKARNDQVEEAVALAAELAAKEPEYLPVHYNLAWWHAVELNDPEMARPYYDKAVALGAAPGRRLERAMR